MSGAHYTIDELRSCALSRDELAIAPIFQHCYDCRQCVDRLAAIILLVESSSELAPSWSPLGVLRRVAAACSRSAPTGGRVDEHLGVSELIACARGRASKQLQRAAAAHCRHCETCSRRFAAIEVLEASAERYSWISNGAVVVVAMLILAAAAVSVYRFATTPSLSVEQQLAALATTEPIPAYIVRFHLGALAPISEMPGVLPVQPRLLAAGEKLANGDNETALRELEQLRLDAPESRNVAGYLAIARYLAGDNSDETGALLEHGASTSVEDNVMATFSRWYLGNLLLRVGKTEDAIEVFRDLAQLPTIPGNLSLEMLQAIESVR